MKTMPNLPNRVQVRLTDSAGRPLSVANVLVAIRFFLDGKYYYGDLLPLTDDNGVTAAERGRIRARFEENRRLFPMDYRIDLDSADAQIQFVLLDRETIRNRLQRVPENSMISDEARALYSKAQNQRLKPTELTTELASTHPPQIAVRLTTDEAGT